MKSIMRTIFGSAILLSGMFEASGSLAAANERAGNNNERAGGKPEAAARELNKGRFDANHRALVIEYFAAEAKAGNCPPGLAKKNNGCTPPGQAQKWRVGQALPRDLVFYELPGALARQLGQPPSGYRYVGVDDNVLLLELGTELVVDVIQALSQ